MRKPIASDSFYSSDPSELFSQVKSFLLEVNKEDAEIIISPHAGYIYSGRCAGEVYSRFDKKEKIDTIILLGPNHSGVGENISISFQSFLTPFGKVDNDNELGRLILNNAKEEGLDIDENQNAHNSEHSLEVQLPFVQTVYGNEVGIVPLIFRKMSHEGGIKFAEVIYRSVKNLERKVKIVLSSDFSHYGDFYGFIPFTDNIKENLYNLDMKAVDFILNLDSYNFYNYAIKKTTICGIYAIIVGIELAKLFNFNSVEKVCFYNSGDVTRDYSNSVDYVGIIFKK